MDDGPIETLSKFLFMWKKGRESKNSCCTKIKCLDES